MRFIGSIGQIASLIQLGLATIEQVVAAVKAGKAQIHTESGRVVPVEELSALVNEVLAKAGQVGDAAVGRVADRHP